MYVFVEMGWDGMLCECGTNDDGEVKVKADVEMTVDLKINGR